MDRPHPRPWIAVRSPLAPDAFVDEVRKALAVADCPVAGQAVPGFINLWLPRAERAFFSPYLSLELAADGTGTVARGRFGPAPAVWTGFMFVYAVLGFVALLSLMIGWAQHLAGEAPTLLMGAPAAVALAAFVYGAEYIGKGMGSEQMIVIRDLLAGVGDVEFPA